MSSFLNSFVFGSLVAIKCQTVTMAIDATSNRRKSPLQFLVAKPLSEYR